MSDRNRQVLYDLQQRPGNNVCADCKSEDKVDWASCNLGVFLCQDCAGVHRSLGVDISRVKSIRLDNWDDDLVQKMAELGNDKVNEKYEQYLPTYYKRPSIKDPGVIRSQFIHAKYERREFMYQDKQSPYNSTKKEGFLMKKGKRDKGFAERKFILNSKDNFLQYFKPNATSPKDTLQLDDVNVVFAPDKVGHSNGFQITYLKNGQTRNLFLYCDDSKEAVDWYTAIRSAKLERRKLAFPDRDEQDLCKDLTQDFLCEGFLKKKGPRNEPYKTRWFTLDRRKLMYLENPLAPFPIKEVYISQKDSTGNNENSKNENLEFVLNTADRTFVLKAESMEDKDKWINAFQNIINTPPTPQDLKLLHNMNRR